MKKIIVLLIIGVFGIALIVSPLFWTVRCQAQWTGH